MEFRFFSKILLLFVIQLFAANAQAATQPNSESAVDQVNTGKQYFNDGRFEDALGAWTLALEDYQKNDDKLGQIRVLQFKADAYMATGQTYSATYNLETALKLADEIHNVPLASQVAISLGTVYMLSNRMEEAQTMLSKAVTQERSEGRSENAALAGNNLGNLFSLTQNYDAAIKAYESAFSDALAANNQLIIAKVSVNLARALADAGRTKDAITQLNKTQRLVEQLDPSHEKAFVLISIGKLYSRLADPSVTSNPDVASQLSKNAFKQAISVADSIKDNRALSFAYGYLGELKERQGHLQDAMTDTQKAIYYLKSISAPEIAYRWQWQEGRLLKAQGKTDLAILAYRRAVNDLQVVRPVMASSSQEMNVDFRQNAGRLYLELADLLLTESNSAKNSDELQAELREVRSTVEMLKGAELENYFRDDCVAALKEKISGIDQLGKHTAAIYPIVFPDRLEIIASFPDGLKRFTTRVTADELTKEVNTFRSLLEKRTTRQYLPHAKKLYSWLIAPMEADFRQQDIDTLVFVPDSTLRTIPISALNDGKNFLVSRFAVATTPGLTLTDPKPLPRKNVKLLTAGLTESVQGFPPLPDVAEEVQQLEDLYPGTVLENDNFTQSNMQEVLSESPYTIVHVASHGKFKDDVKNSFLLTYNGKLDVNTLQSYMASTTYRKQPVELLTLSACQTAVGDDKAALGLGGIAVKAGARSALATLWYINDTASSILITDFYDNLKKSDISKAKALQKAQLSLLADPRFTHPSYWAPFLLIGNWL